MSPCKSYPSSSVTGQNQSATSTLEATVQAILQNDDVSDTVISFVDNALRRRPAQSSQSRLQTAMNILDEALSIVLDEGPGADNEDVKNGSEG